MSNTWTQVDKGRYATVINGHALQVVRNPDASDPRRYISVVDKTPVGQPSWDTNQAKTKAINFINGKSRARKGKPSWAAKVQPTIDPLEDVGRMLKPEPKPEPTPELVWPGVDALMDAYSQAEEIDADEPVPEPAPLPDPKPEPDDGLEIVPDHTTDADLDFEEPEPESEPEPLPDTPDLTTEPPMAAMTTDIIVTMRASLRGTDTIAVVGQVKAAVELLRELGIVECHLEIPSGIKL